MGNGDPMFEEVFDIEPEIKKLYGEAKRLAKGKPGRTWVGPKGIKKKIVKLVEGKCKK